MRYTTLSDAIEQAVIPALGEYGNDYDLEAIAREAFEYKVDTDANGNELLNTAGFEQVVDETGFWAIAEKYDTTTETEATAIAWLTLDAGCLIHGESVEVGILDYDDTEQVTGEPLAPVSLPVTVSDAREDHKTAQTATEARLTELGWETVGDWDAVDTGYTIKVRRA